MDKTSLRCRKCDLIVQVGDLCPGCILEEAKISNWKKALGVGMTSYSDGFIEIDTRKLDNIGPDDLRGKRFGDLIVVTFAFMIDEEPYWVCQCSCNNYIIGSTKQLEGKIEGEILSRCDKHQGK